ncbi:ECF RNA polymerase sigma factor SigD [Aquisphaera giovannonii]|uniref:ECF RNA polymerase sigma factor SigD n=1 Tax=Aquisphaera giovannonii TaxID=406548 RepID=A0A5B9W2B2_9BACT|nr:sigma-70 family RNA polymerase sigma factor [Aquisphaera giovannonii]QEH34261.1 ECF RNA polymerase sigma factor SigD [Aquisphaera giovannonii]
MSRGEKEAEFSERLIRLQVQLFGYIYSLVRDMDDADDLYQQTCLALWKKIDEYDPARSFAAWAFGIARFEVSNFLRSRSRSKLYFSDELNLLLAEAHGEIDLGNVEDRLEAMNDCINKLRRRDQELLDACYRRSMRVAEVAQTWGRSSQSIHNSLKRLRQAIQECVRRTLSRESMA